MKRSIAFLMILILILSYGTLMTAGKASAASFSTELYDDASNGVVDIGGTVTFTFKISSDVKFEFQAELSPSSGLTIQSISGDVDSNGTTIVNNVSSTSYSVTVVCSAASSGDQTFSVSGLASTVSGSIESTNFSDSDTVYIRSQAEIDESKQAEADAASKAAYESSVAASKAARESSEAASREAESRSIEESRQASSEAERRSIEAVEESKRQSQAEEENEKNSAEASRASAEDAAKQSAEESSIAESIKESSIGRQSDKASKSTEKGSSSTKSSSKGTTAEGTSASVKKEYTYVTRTIGRKTFYFVAPNDDDEVPEGLTKVNLQVGNKAVLAFTGKNYGEHIYLVLGTFTSGKEPDYYYYNSDKELLFEVSQIPETEKAPEEEPSAEPSEPVTEEGELVSLFDLCLLSGLSAVLGAGITFLVILLVRKRREE